MGAVKSCSAPRRMHVGGSDHAGTLGTIRMMIRGELASGRGSSRLRMAAAAAARPSSVSSCTSEIDAKLADAFSFRMDISLEAGAKRSGEGVAMLGYESFNGERGPSPDLFDEIVGPGEHPVRVVDGDLAQVLHQELAAGPAGNPVGFGIK